MLAAVPITADGATPAPVKNGNLVFVENADYISTQAPGPGNTYSFLTGGYNPEYSPDGKQLAFTRADCDDCNSPDYKAWRDIYVRVLSTGAERRVARFKEGDFGYWTALTWSPDGKQLVVSSTHSLVKVVVASGKQTVIFKNQAPQDFVRAPAWSPDGTRIAFSLGAAITLIDTDGTHLRTFTSGGTRNLYADWSPDSRTIAFVTDRFQGELNTEVVTLPRSGKGTPVRVSYSSNPTGRGYIGVAWSPDAKKIAALSFYHPTDPDEEGTQVRGYLPDGSHDYSLTGRINGDDTPEGLDWAPKVTTP